MDLTKPYRGDSAGRPAGLALPPRRMPLLRAGRMLKRWRYVGVYGPELMLCVGCARIGPAPQVWWAIWDRRREDLHERTRQAIGRGRVRLPEGEVLVHDGFIEIELVLDEEPGLEVLTPAGEAYIWTRKQGGIPVCGRVRLPDREVAIDARAFIDDSAGYHDRHTAWRWSAGLGTATDGRALAWNLVDGIHDSPRDSERTVWVDGAPAEVGPVQFATDLSAVAFAEGGALRCAAEATRAREDNLLLFRSSYEQPFGSFGGELPGGITLAEGYGVMERHDVVW